MSSWIRTVSAALVVKGILLYRCFYELSRGLMLRLGLKERSKYALIRCSGAHHAYMSAMGAMGRSKKVNQAQKEMEELAL